MTASALNIHQVIFTSSVAVYGFVEKETDEGGRFDPFNHYG
jgi:UDP-glucose 4-epimerase